MYKEQEGYEPGRDRDDGRRRVACGGGGWWWVCGGGTRGQLPTTTPTHDERCINAMINALGW